jgi:hypothetical protein
MADTAPLTRTIKAFVPAQATANATQDQAIGEAPFAGTVTSVKLVPEAALTANGTNFRTFRVVNKGQAGVGTTVVATFATDTVATDDLVAFDEKLIPLSAVTNATVVAAGDVLAADETVAAAGVAHSGYTVEVEITRS